MGMPKEEKPKTPEWITTFADMISLLLTFFILLLTFATPSMQKLWELQGSIDGAFGFIRSDAGESDVPPLPLVQGRDMRNSQAPRRANRFRILKDREPEPSLMQLIDKSGVALDLERIGNGWRIRLGDIATYEKNQIELPVRTYELLARIGREVVEMPFGIGLVGYAGQDEVLENGDQGMALSLRRAQRAAERLASDRRTLLPGHRFLIAGYPPDDPNQKLGHLDLILVEDDSRPWAP
jgi:chemotaxis protein MotB